MLRIDETICAPATTGRGAIAIIRLSGPDSLSICSRVFYPASLTAKLSEQKANTIIYGEIRDGDELIDDVLLSVFRSPRSYTGEDSVEISCHGSLYIQQRILELLIASGAAMALPGEFTRRAFLNGKMDLSQAEAVADLISSESKMSHRIAINQMRGAFSDDINFLRAELLHFASLIELELDFGEEDVVFANRLELKEIVDKVISMATGLAGSFKAGNIIKNGIPVVITGNPNSGKSTLLNALLREERAIVSEIPGTTRDFIEDVITIDGVLYRFIDTAGLRDTDDIIENLGIQKTYEKIDKASVIIVITDINDSPETMSGLISNVRKKRANSEQKIIVLVNKIDTDNSGRQLLIRESLSLYNDESLLFLSARYGNGLDNLKDMLANVIDKSDLLSENVIISNVRHYEALVEVLQSMQRVKEGLDNLVPSDFIAIDIRHAIHYLGEITGEITSDEILENIFRNFCIGK